MIDVRVLEDAGLAEQLTELVNAVYAVAERGLWRDGMKRTTAAELADEIRAGEVVVATRDDQVVGCVRVHDVADDTSEFGILVSAPDERNTGVGRALLDYIEQRGRERGLRAMQLELLVPREWAHPMKEFLKEWYGRRGYALIGLRAMDEAYPHLAPLLATPCDLQVREKPLVNGT
ncbi:MAG TPA: GNAT family N-acetyltransferase [Solirubrobacteraceae bacterium]|nr:GNAT family N-acetyltransferase [Solirubrobacteraceae bacterium]